MIIKQGGSVREFLIPGDVGLIDKLFQKEIEYQQSIGKTKKIIHKECGRAYWFDHDLVEEEFKFLDEQCVCKHPDLYDEGIKIGEYMAVCDLGHSFHTRYPDRVSGGSNGISHVTISEPCRRCKKCLEIYKFTDKKDVAVSNETKMKINALDQIAKAQAGMKYGFQK